MAIFNSFLYVYQRVNIRSLIGWDPLSGETILNCSIQGVRLWCNPTQKQKTDFWALLKHDCWCYMGVSVLSCGYPQIIQKWLYLELNHIESHHFGDPQETGNLHIIAQKSRAQEIRWKGGSTSFYNLSDPNFKEYSPRIWPKMEHRKNTSISSTFPWIWPVHTAENSAWCRVLLIYSVNHIIYLPIINLQLSRIKHQWQFQEPQLEIPPISLRPIF